MASAKRTREDGGLFSGEGIKIDVEPISKNHQREYAAEKPCIQ